jgi:hypothetical protein
VLLFIGHLLFLIKIMIAAVCESRELGFRLLFPAHVANCNAGVVIEIFHLCGNFYGGERKILSLTENIIFILEV